MKVCGVLIAILLVVSVAHAQEEIQIHGFGGWAYGNTDGNNYLSGTDDGEFKNVQLAFLVSAAPADRIRINCQVFWEEGLEGSEAVVDYAFAEYKFSDKLRVRMGKVKQPYGVYAEIFDVGTLRPFFFLPQSIYGDGAFASEAYRGVGITGSSIPFGRWAASYDAYGGQLTLGGESSAEAEEDEITNMLGGRLTIHTPLNGLDFGVSAYSGKERHEEDIRRSTIGLHARYDSEPWTIRAEIARQTESDLVTIKAGFAEVAYRIDEHWQPAVLYDSYSSHFNQEAAAPGESDEKHKEWGVGLNYWFAPNLVLKASFQHVRGARFVEVESESETEEEPETKLFTLGVQFSF